MKRKEENTCQPKELDTLKNFKKSIVTLYQNGKTINQLSKDYGFTWSYIDNWVKQYSEVKIDEDTTLTALQIKELQRKNVQLEEENLIVKKAIAIFTPNSRKDYMPFIL